MKITKSLLKELIEACEFYSINTSNPDTATFYKGKVSAYKNLLEFISE